MKRHLLEVNYNESNEILKLLSMTTMNTNYEYVDKFIVRQLALSKFFPTKSCFKSSMIVLNDFIKTHENLRYSCPVCGESYTRIESYRKHRCGSSFRKAKANAVKDFLGVKSYRCSFVMKSSSSFLFRVRLS